MRKSWFSDILKPSGLLRNRVIKHFLSQRISDSLVVLALSGSYQKLFVLSVMKIWRRKSTKIFVECQKLSSILESNLEHLFFNTLTSLHWAYFLKMEKILEFPTTQNRVRLFVMASKNSLSEKWSQIYWWSSHFPVAIKTFR